MAVKTINYEVYALQEGRWGFHAHFDGKHRDAAIEEAQTIEKYPNITGAVVVREAYSASDMDSTESIIYHTPSMKSKPSVNAISGAPARPAKKGVAKKAEAKKAASSPAASKKASGGSKGSPSKVQAASPTNNGGGARPQERPRLQQTESEDLNVIGILIAFLLSSIAGTVASVAVYFALRAIGLFLGRNVTLAILIGVFVCTFLLFFVPKLKKILASSSKKITTSPAPRPLDMPRSAASMTAAAPRSPAASQSGIKTPEKADNSG
ncbi:MAG: hypothetical protein R3261_04910, partial [Alphaproteobacteria bacterium]|nr:hypothetical protein [Alphaproteobacteria bacterium]